MRLYFNLNLSMDMNKIQASQMTTTTAMTTMMTTTTTTTTTPTRTRQDRQESLERYYRRKKRWEIEQSGLHPDDIDYDPNYVYTPWTDSDDDSDPEDKRRKQKMTKIDYKKFQEKRKSRAVSRKKKI